MDRIALRVVLVEDNPDDAELIAAELEAAGYAVEVAPVQDEAGFRAAFSSGRVDLVIADFSLPRWSGFQALALHRAIAGDAPFLLVSGTIGEELAVHSIKAGADDCLLKSHL